MTISPEHTKITLICNPFAGKWAEVNIKKAHDILKSKGFDVDIRLTQYKGHAEEIAKEIAQSGGSKEHEQLIISAGGDGTYNE
ncbi:MAG: acylglycerol kinase family protein, partial [Thermodesulfovibrionales bacterium]